MNGFFLFSQTCELFIYLLYLGYNNDNILKLNEL